MAFLHLMHSLLAIRLKIFLLALRIIYLYVTSILAFVIVIASFPNLLCHLILYLTQRFQIFLYSNLLIIPFVIAYFCMCKKNCLPN